MQNKSNEEVATFFNGVVDALGNHALHICAMYGSCMLPSFVLVSELDRILTDTVLYR